MMFIPYVSFTFYILLELDLWQIQMTLEHGRISIIVFEAGFCVFHSGFMLDQTVEPDSSVMETPPTKKSPPPLVKQNSFTSKVNQILTAAAQISPKIKKRSPFSRGNSKDNLLDAGELKHNVHVRHLLAMF